MDEKLPENYIYRLSNHSWDVTLIFNVVHLSNLNIFILSFIDMCYFDFFQFYYYLISGNNNSLMKFE